MLKMSDADVKRLFDMAGGVGLTVPELLQNFIGDLVDGTYSNGSDEREYAQRWLSRCGFHMCAEHTFLRHLMQSGNFEDFMREWEELQSSKEELVYAVEHPDEYEQDEVAGIEENIKYCSEGIADAFSEYVSSRKNECGTLDEEMEKVLEWHSQLKKMIL